MANKLHFDFEASEAAIRRAMAAGISAAGKMPNADPLYIMANEFFVEAAVQLHMGFMRCCNAGVAAKDAVDVAAALLSGAMPLEQDAAMMFAALLAKNIAACDQAEDGTMFAKYTPVATEAGSA